MEIILKTDERPQCTGVSWGHFSMKSGLNEDIGTSSLGSCFAFVVLDKGKDEVFFAHVSNDTETDWIISHLIKPPTNFQKKLNWVPQYYAFKGKEPEETTKTRIDRIDKYLGHNYLKQGHAKTGAVILQGSNWREKPTFFIVHDITPFNSENYKAKNEIGMGHAGDMLPMPGSDFVSEI